MLFFFLAHYSDLVCRVSWFKKDDEKEDEEDEEDEENKASLIADLHRALLQNARKACSVKVKSMNVF
jgi:hypothetical protein